MKEEQMKVQVGDYGTITRATREVAHSISPYGEPKHGWQVTFARPNGEVWFLSQLDDEERWVLDARIAANGAVVHMNGFGARHVPFARLSDEAADELNHALALHDYLEHLEKEHDADAGRAWL